MRKMRIKEKHQMNDDEHKMECIRYDAEVYFDGAFDYFRTSAPELKEERAMLLEEYCRLNMVWKVASEALGMSVLYAGRNLKMDGAPAGYEECIDYIFPDEVATAPNSKILEASYKWNKLKTGSDED